MPLKQIKQIVRHLPDATLVVDLQGTIVAANAKIEEATGFPESELLGQSIDSRFVDSNGFLPLCRRSAHPTPGILHTATDPSERLRCEGSVLVDDTERPRWLLLRVRRSVQSVLQFSALNEKIEQLNREITSRKAVEQALREQIRFAQFGRDISLTLSRGGPADVMLKQCTELLTEQLGDVLAQIWVVPGASKQLELVATSGVYADADEPIVPAEDFCVDFVFHSQQPLRSDALRTDPYWRDQQCVTKGRFIAFAGYPLIVDGVPLGVLAVFGRQSLAEQAIRSMESVANAIALGIERKRVEQKVQGHALQLERAGKRKDEFLAMLAHELRNPLAPIRSGLDLLQMDHGANETIRLMQQQVEQMVQLVDDLLDVARLMQGKIRLKRSTVCLQDVVERAVETSRSVITAGQHDLHLALPDTKVWVHWDEVRISQVIANLLNNAAKYTPRGGEIRIEAAIVDDGIELAVQDNGIGLEPDFADEIFEIFAQADRSLDRDQGGLGVGLTLVKRLVEMHGGTVEVASEGIDCGSTFTIRIDDCLADRALPPPASSEPSEALSSRTPFRVLVVDDVVGTAMIMKKILVRKWQFGVETAHTGPMAIERAKEFEPDLILLDVGLPELNGYEVATELRRLPQFQKTMLVALTGYARDEDRAQSRRAGFDMHLAKPVSLDQIEEVVNALTARVAADAERGVSAS